MASEHDAWENYTTLLARCEQAEATVAACKADAERYRFLRSTMYRDETFEIAESYLRWKVVGACPESHEWDAAIDAARTAAEAAKGGEQG